MTFRLPYVTPAKIQFQKQSSPDQLHTDINLYPNPIPFNGVLAQPQFDIPSAVWVVLPNIALTTVNPFTAVDWQKPLNIPEAPSPNYPNIAIRTVVVQSPIIPVDMSSSGRSVNTSSPIYPNIVLENFSTPFVNLWVSTTSNKTLPNYTSANIALLNTVVSNPFSNEDFSSTKYPSNSSAVSYPNLVLLQTVFTNPFYTHDFSTSKNISTQPNQLYPNIVLNAPVVIVQPFFAQDFSRPFTSATAKSDQQSVNINLFTNPIPFGPYDYPRIVATRFLPFDTNGYPNVVLPASSTPFVSYNWSKQFDIRASIEPQYPNIVVLQQVLPPFVNYNWSQQYGIRASIDPQYLNIVVLQPVLPPFSQLDWSKAYTISPNATNQNDLPNLLLIQPSIPGNPLGINGWIDWSYVKGPVIIVPDQNNLPNIVLFNTAPIPPPDEVIVGGKWRWLEGYNDLVKHRNDIPGDIKKAAAVLSKMGGHARAQSLTSTQRSTIASMAANARWNPKR